MYLIVLGLYFVVLIYCGTRHIIDNGVVNDSLSHYHSHLDGYKVHVHSPVGISHLEIQASNELLQDQKYSNNGKQKSELSNILKNLRQHIKVDSHKLVSRFNFTKSTGQHVNSSHLEPDSKKIRHSYDIDILVKEFETAKKAIKNIFFAKTHLKNVTNKIELIKVQKELIKMKNSGQNTGSIFLPTSFLSSNMDLMRAPFASAALKFSAQMYNDITDYNYTKGKYGLKPDFCWKHSCASFRVVCKNRLYEVRNYGNLTLVSITVNGNEYLNTGLKSGIIEIFKYLNGNNDRNVTIPFAVPVTVKGPLSTSTFPRARLLEIINGGVGPKISLTLVPPFNVDPPKPTCPSLKIEHLTNDYCYVRMFGGYALPSTFVSKGDEFIKILRNNDQFITSSPIAAVYNNSTPASQSSRHIDSYKDPLFDTSIHAPSDLSDRISSHEDNPKLETPDIAKKVKQYIKDLEGHTKQDKESKLSLIKSGEKQVSEDPKGFFNKLGYKISDVFSSVKNVAKNIIPLKNYDIENTKEKLIEIIKSDHSADTNKTSRIFSSVKKSGKKNFLSKAQNIKNITKKRLTKIDESIPKVDTIRTSSIFDPIIENTLFTKTHDGKNKTKLQRLKKSSNIFLSTSFLSNIDYMRVPFVGAALKFFAEMYNDINEYNYKKGKYGRKPEFCGKHCCPSFEVVCKNDLYEVRNYGTLTLVTYTITGKEYLKTGMKSGFIEIFKYLNGNNDRNATIPFTVPIVVNGPLSTSTCPRTRLLEILNGGDGPTISLSLAAPFDSNPPIPTCPSVKIKTDPNGFCYVRMFGGFALPSTFVSKGNEFIKILQNNGQFITQKPMVALYNNPSQFANRHNEIFIPIINPAQGDRYC
ncbi:unnamed protein product [Gordionus sp. m RMFG-2023]